ncbi:MAG TPA: MFS transporter [Gammaproteobacteria bacterium]|jgi:MFS family permease|nr:MAG: MFS transporter [Gammaproteobacteria bacterium]HIB81929.1 MFS transporter [Gammaproteobacteria bacterium]HIO17196.1 MFS transporter [Gammaproteobacteria bacterium]HIO34488.1 MFS transporter [Gammaproteobacteria bacterium]
MRNRIREVYPLIRLATVLALMTLGCSAMYAGVMVLEPLALELDTGRGNSSLIYGTFMIGFALGGVFMGRLADRMGIMIPALIGSLALPAGFYLAAHASSILEICLAFSLLCGFLGSSFSMAPLIADISHWFSRRRGLAVGIAFSGSYVAGAIWPPILQRMFDAQGWRESFVDLALLTLILMALLSLLLYPRSPINEQLPTASSANSNLTNSAISAGTLQSLIYLAGFGCCVAMAMPQVHIVPYVMDLGHPAIRGAEMLGLMLGFGVISRVGSGWLSDRIGGLATLVLGSALQVAVLIAFLTGNSLVFLYGISIAFGLSQGGIVPSYTIILRAFFPPKQAGWRISTSFLFTVAGMAFGGWIAGLLYDLTGSYTVSFLNAIGFNILNLWVAASLLKKSGAIGTRASTSAVN